MVTNLLKCGKSQLRRVVSYTCFILKTQYKNKNLKMFITIICWDDILDMLDWQTFNFKIKSTCFTFFLFFNTTTRTFQIAYVAWDSISQRHSRECLAYSGYSINISTYQCILTTALKISTVVHCNPITMAFIQFQKKIKLTFFLNCSLAALSSSAHTPKHSRQSLGKSQNWKQIPAKKGD